MFLEVLPLDTVAKYGSAMHVPQCSAECQVQSSMHSVFLWMKLALVTFFGVFLEFGFEIDGLSFLFQLVTAASLFLLPIKTKKACLQLLCSHPCEWHQHLPGSSGKIHPEFILDPCIRFPITFRHFLACFSLISLISFKTSHTPDCMFTVILLSLLHNPVQPLP